jgi:hypothetical protein
VLKGNPFASSDIRIISLTLSRPRTHLAEPVPEIYHAIQSEQPRSAIPNSPVQPGPSEMKAFNPNGNKAQHSAKTKENTKGKIRHVYVLARPIKAAGVFSLLSYGKFPLCHWGVLLSEHGTLGHEAKQPKDEGTTILPRLREGYSSTLPRVTPLQWGSLFELYRDPNTDQNQPHVVYNFGHQQLRQEWQFLTLRRVGTTTFQDDQVYEKGTFPSLLPEPSKHRSNHLLSSFYHFNLPSL